MSLSQTGSADRFRQDGHDAEVTVRAEAADDRLDPHHEYPPIVFTERKFEQCVDAAFGLRLFGVTRETGVLATPEHGESRGAALTVGLAVDQRISIVLANQPGRGRPAFSLDVVGHAMGATIDSSAKAAKTLWRNLDVNLVTAAPACRFSPAVEVVDAHPGGYAYRTRLVPHGCCVTRSRRHQIGFRPDRSPSRAGRAYLPVPVTATCSASGDRIIRALHQTGGDTRLLMSLSPVTLSDYQLRLLRDVVGRLESLDPSGVIAEGGQSSTSPATAATLAQLHAVASLWLQSPSGTLVDCLVQSSEPIVDSLLNLVGRELFPGQPLRREDLAASPQEATTAELTTFDVDLRSAIPQGVPLPSLWPSCEAAATSGYRTVVDPGLLRLPADGVVLGVAESTREQRTVRFASGDRSRPCYVVGATGTGKSTLLFNMAAQDIVNGDGVMVVDPHGDLFSQLLRTIPRACRNDVVVFDPSDSGWAVGLNPLAGIRNDDGLQINFVVNELIKTFERLYDMRVAGGPMFEQYMRNALMLILENEREDSTLMDVPHLFEDAEFRRRLVKGCTNPRVASFWTHQAERAGGEASLNNIAPYITCKLNQFTNNAVLRPIVGQRASTIDFRRAMDTRKIILVNLATGSLGELDTQLLGMLLLGKVYSAAMSRSTMPAVARCPFRLYVDEFQQFTTDTVAHMLSGARKFGLHLTLANQTLTQLLANHGQQNIMDAVLGNCGTMICFRLGVLDADRLEAYTRPELTSRDLQDLPDHHAVIRLLSKSTLTRPFVLATHPAQALPAAVPPGTVIRRSRKRYARPVAEIEAELRSRFS